MNVPIGDKLKQKISRIESFFTVVENLDLEEIPLGTINDLGVLVKAHITQTYQL